MVFNSTNQCPNTITVCYTDSLGLSLSANVTPGGSFPITDSGVPSVVIWGFPGNSGAISDCMSAKLQADLAEFTINGTNNTDSYDISNVVCPSGPPASLPFPACFRMLSKFKKKKKHMSSSCAHKTSDSLAISNLNLR